MPPSSGSARWAAHWPKSSAPTALDLLETYQSERDPHVRTFIELTVQMGQVINTTADASAAGNIVELGVGRQEISQLRPALGLGLTAGESALTGHLFPQPNVRFRGPDIAGSGH